MKGKSLGYDPKLGAKFAAESNGLVIGRARSLPRKSEAQATQEYVEEHGRAPDAQQLHDAMMSPSTSSNQMTEEQEERASRRHWTVGRNQQLVAKDSLSK